MLRRSRRNDQGKTLMFAARVNIHFGQNKAPAEVDVTDDAPQST